MRYPPRLIAGVIALACLFGASSAQGAISIGSANVFSQPGVAVDTAGTAYIAWRGPESGVGSLQFCRLPRGAAQCNVRSTIAAPGDTVSRAFVTVSGSRVIVWQYRYGAVSGMFRFTSTDRGANFGPGVKVGSVPFSEAVPGPGDTLSGVTNAESVGGAFENVPSTGSPGTFPYAALSSDHLYNGTIGLAPTFSDFTGQILPVTVFTTGSDEAETRVYDGSGDVNDVSNWLPPLDLGVARYPKLVSGPKGLYLFAGSADNEIFVREWNGLAAAGYRSFRPPVPVAEGADPSTLHAFEDAAGRFHVVFVRGDADGLHLVHAVSDDYKNWRMGNVVTQTGVEGGFSGTRIATAPDHVGVVVWNAGLKQIRVAAVGPDAPVDPQTEIGRSPDQRSLKSKAKFTFKSSKPGSSFECKLDKHPFTACISPKKVKVKPGKHVFKVRAIDAAGNVDPTAAHFKWKVLKHGHR